jgi:hypothetical protein
MKIERPKVKKLKREIVFRATVKIGRFFEEEIKVGLAGTVPLNKRTTLKKLKEEAHPILERMLETLYQEIEERKLK